MILEKKLITTNNFLNIFCFILIFIQKNLFCEDYFLINKIKQEVWIRSNQGNSSFRLETGEECKIDSGFSEIEIQYHENNIFQRFYIISKENKKFNSLSKNFLILNNMCNLYIVLINDELLALTEGMYKKYENKKSNSEESLNILDLCSIL